MARFEEPDFEDMTEDDVQAIEEAEENAMYLAESQRWEDR